MNARDELYESMTPCDRHPAPGEADAVNALIDTFEAEIRKDCAATVRGMAPKYLDSDMDVRTFHVLDAAAGAITAKGK